MSDSRSLFGAELPAPQTKKRRFLAFGIVLTLACAAFAAYRFFWPKPFDPVATPAGYALGRAVPGYLVEIHHAARLDAESAKALSARAGAVLAPEARSALGAEVVAPLEDMLRRAAELTAEDVESVAASDAFLNSAASVDAAFAARKLPYFLDADLLVGGDPPGKRPVLFSFYVEREAEVVAAGAKVRAVHVRRLDDLNIGQAYLGYTRPRTPAAIILLDEIEGQLVQYVLPALHGSEDALLVDLDSLDPQSAWQKDLHDRAAEIVREAHRSLPGIDRAAVDRIGEILARRRALVRKWRGSLDKIGLRLRVPERLIPEADYARDLWGKIPVNELREWNELHEELTGAALSRAFYQLRDEHALAVQEHEVQHRIDYQRELMNMPEPLARMLGVKDALDLREGSLPKRARDELSAYLAELARGKSSPLLGLMLLSQFAFDRGQWGGAYCYAALAAIEGIGQELGLADERLIGGGRVLRDRLTARFLAITSRSPDDLRAAARRLWERYYGDKLVDVQEASATSYPAWLH